MLTSVETLIQALKKSPYPVFRDKAKKNTKYPYIIYSHVAKNRKSASSKTYRRIQMYQVSLFTNGTEKDLILLEESLEVAHVNFEAWNSMPGSENDDTITHYFTNVRCLDD